MEKSSIFVLLAWMLLLISYSNGATPTNEFVRRSSVPELSYMNTSVDPCENFYQYACGNFKNVQPLPDGKYNWDHFTILQDEIHQLAKDILMSTRKPTDPVSLQKAKAAYTSCVDVNYADKLELPQVTFMRQYGIWPAISLENDEDIKVTWNDIGDLVALYGVPLFFNFQILSNYWDPTDNFIYLYRDAVSNPSTYYGRLEQNLEDFLGTHRKTQRSTDSKSEPLPFEVFMRGMAFHLRDVMGTWKSDDQIVADLDEVLNFMRVLQPGGFVEDTATILPLDSLITVGQLQEWTDKQFGEDYPLDWVEYFNHLFKASGTTITSDVKFYHDGPRLLYGVLNLFKQAEPRLLKNFIMTRLFTFMAPDSDRVMREVFDTYYTNQGYSVFERPEYCLRKILGYPNNVQYSMAVTYEYQRYHFNINKLQKAAEMIDDIQAAFKEILHSSDWMDDQTKANALKKADEMIILLGYPEYVEDPRSLDEYYDGLRVCTWEHFWNSQRSRSYSQALNFKEIALPRNRELWNLSPLEVNGYYNRATNRILNSTGILIISYYFLLQMWCMVETDYYLQQMHKSNSYPPGRYRVIGALSNMEEFAEAFNCPVGSKMNPDRIYYRIYLLIRSLKVRGSL
ncbi:hypothetical protein Trydic_g2387 [Trypoxylus dichotomus]